MSLLKPVLLFCSLANAVGNDMTSAMAKFERAIPLLREDRSNDSVVYNAIPQSRENTNSIRKLLEKERSLYFTGHLWDACWNPDDVRLHENTQYDDEHDPFCQCYVDQYNEIFVLCSLGDESCEGDDCSGTVEAYFFSDDTGDLLIKKTCNLCTGGNCTNVEEICTQVLFSPEDEPIGCILIEYFDDKDPEICEDCSLCTDDQGNQGINTTCFGQGEADVCDTTASEHIHNLAYVPEDDAGPPVGGEFGEICGANEEAALYNRTLYDTGLEKVCDCHDPSSGVIVCDLFDGACFANVCTEISNIFYFDADGAFTAKMTFDQLSGIGSTVEFDESGKPTSCLAFYVGAQGIEYCTDCRICQDSSGFHGIKVDCYGAVDENVCLTSNGEAVYNVSPLEPSPGGKNKLLIVLAVVGGCMFVVFNIAMISYASRRKNGSVPPPPLPPLDPHGEPMQDVDTVVSSQVSDEDALVLDEHTMT